MRTLWRRLLIKALPSLTEHLELVPHKKYKPRPSLKPDFEQLETRFMPAVINFASGSYSVLEDAGKITLTLSLDSPANNTSVTVGVSGGTATSGDDYRLPLTSINFPSGAYSTTLDLYVTDDDLSELSETVVLQLSNPSSGDSLGLVSSSTVTVTNQTPTTWLLTPQANRLTDPFQGDWWSFGRALYAPADGDLRVTHPLTFGRAQVGATDAWGRAGPAASLVYRASAADGRPVAEAVLSGTTANPASLTWDGTTVNSPGSVEGKVYSIALTPTGTSSGAQAWSGTLVATFSIRGDIRRTAVGTAPSAGSGTAIAAGWGIAGVDRLELTHSAGVVWVYGAGGGRYFTGTGGTYTSPAGDFGTLVKNGDNTFTYTALDQLRGSSTPAESSRRSLTHTACHEPLPTPADC